jgi:septin family protein
VYYYHEVGNSEINAQAQTFNILICGQAGVRKSSFINQFPHEKVITSYIHPEYTIKLYDNQDFENDDTVKI